MLKSRIKDVFLRFILKVLIFSRSRALGDGIFLSGYPKIIKELYPEAVIDVFCTKMHAVAYMGNPDINKIYYFRTYKKPFNRIVRQKIFNSPIFQLKNMIKARRENYDIFIDVDSDLHLYNRFMVRFIMRAFLSRSHLAQNNMPLKEGLAKGKRFIVGRNIPNKYKVTPDDMRKLYTHLFGYDKFLDKKAVDFSKPFESLPESRWLGSSFNIFQEGIDDIAKYWLYLDEAALKKAEEYYSSIVPQGKRIIIFNGEGSDKSISSQRVMQVLISLLEDSENYIFILGYFAYYDKYESIVKEINNPRLNITYKTSIADTFALISKAQLLISVDTAVIHIASAFSVPIVEILSYKLKDNQVGMPRFTDYRLVICKSDTFDLDSFDLEELSQAATALLNKYS